MKLDVLESGKNKLKLAVHGETHTLMNILRENCWKEKANQATYTMEHPYLSDPYITVRSDDPKKTLKSAAQLLIDQTKEFSKEFNKAAK